MATHSVFLPREPTEEPGGLQSIRLYSRTQLKQFSMHACIACIRQIVWETMEGERIKEKIAWGTWKVDRARRLKYMSQV